MNQNFVDKIIKDTFPQNETIKKNHGYYSRAIIREVKSTENSQERETITPIQRIKTEENIEKDNNIKEFENDKTVLNFELINDKKIENILQNEHLKNNQVDDFKVIIRDKSNLDASQKLENNIKFEKIQDIKKKNIKEDNNELEIDKKTSILQLISKNDKEFENFPRNESIKSSQQMQNEMKQNDSNENKFERDKTVLSISLKTQNNQNLTEIRLNENSKKFQANQKERNQKDHYENVTQIEKTKLNFEHQSKNDNTFESFSQDEEIKTDKMMQNELTKKDNNEKVIQSDKSKVYISQKPDYSNNFQNIQINEALTREPFQKEFKNRDIDKELENNKANLDQEFQKNKKSNVEIKVDHKSINNNLVNSLIEKDSIMEKNNFYLDKQSYNSIQLNKIPNNDNLRNDKINFDKSNKKKLLLSNGNLLVKNIEVENHKLPVIHELNDERYNDVSENNIQTSALDQQTSDDLVEKSKLSDSRLSSQDLEYIILEKSKDDKDIIDFPVIKNNNSSKFSQSFINKISRSNFSKAEDIKLPPIAQLEHISSGSIFANGNDILNSNDQEKIFDSNYDAGKDNLTNKLPLIKNFGLY